MTARRRLEAYWMACEKEGDTDDIGILRSRINDLALILTELQREVQGDPDAFWRLTECLPPSSPDTDSSS